MRRPIKADSAIMHWSKEIIALKAGGKTLQIFDLGQKTKIKSTTMQEDVVFWKWISETTLGLVTDTSVYHWNIFDASQVAPQKVFERNQNLSGCQIINYRVSEDEKWMCVVGISQQQGRVAGSMQLYLGRFEWTTQRQIQSSSPSPTDLPLARSCTSLRWITSNPTRNL